MFENKRFKNLRENVNRTCYLDKMIFLMELKNSSNIFGIISLLVYIKMK